MTIITAYLHGTNIHHIMDIYLIGEILVYHPRRWHNVKPVLAERLVFVGHYVTERAPGEGMGYGYYLQYYSNECVISFN